MPHKGQWRGITANRLNTLDQPGRVLLLAVLPRLGRDRPYRGQFDQGHGPSAHTVRRYVPFAALNRDDLVIGLVDCNNMSPFALHVIQRHA
jgi:hypothetical protein